MASGTNKVHVRLDKVKVYLLYSDQPSQTSQESVHMFELSLAHLNGADREREIDAALRRCQILKIRPADVAPDSRTIVLAGGRRLAMLLRTTDR